jgi:hypothetical protein
MGELGALLGEVVDAPGSGASQNPAAEAARFAHAEIVDMKEEDVRSLRGHGLLRQGAAAPLRLCTRTAGASVN